MNYGQTAIGEVRVIANYLGINPWEFESPFVLKIRYGVVSIYRLYIGDSSLTTTIGCWSSNLLLSYLLVFCISEYILYYTMEIRYSLQILDLLKFESPLLDTN